MAVVKPHEARPYLGGSLAGSVPCAVAGCKMLVRWDPDARRWVHETRQRHNTMPGGLER